MNKTGCALVVAGAIAITAPCITKADTKVDAKDPKLIAPVTTNRAVRPNVNGFAINRSLAQPNSLPKEGTQKALVVRVNFNGKPFTKDEAYYNDLVFGSGTDSVKNWVNYQSMGKFHIEPLGTKDTNMPGVITVNVDESKYPGIDFNDYKAQDKLMNDILNEVKDKIPADVLATADKNGDKSFIDGWIDDNGSQPEELAMFFVFSGAQNAGTQPKSWPHLSTVGADVNGYKLNNSVVVTSEIVDSNFVGSAIFNHEFTHGLSARDMYADEISIGPWSIMDKCYGNRENTSFGQNPNPLDPIHKTIFGWSTQDTLTPSKDTKYQFDKRNKYLIIPHPTDKKIEYLFEYRDFSDVYEKSNFRYGMQDSGVIVWKINRDSLPTDWSDGDWKINTQGPRTSVSVLTTDKSDITVANSLHKVGTTFKVDGLNMDFAVSDKALDIKPIETKPEVEPIISAKNLSLKINDKFDPKVGVTATDETGKDITSDIKVVENTVDTSKAGNYIVVYQVTTSKGKTISKRIDVVVAGDTKPIAKPTITVKDRTVKVGSKFNPLEGVVAKDGEGKDITNLLRVEENTVDTSKTGNYVVVVSVTDSHGQTTSKPFIVTVVNSDEPPQPEKDTTPPTIEGLEDITLKVGDKFNPLEGISVKDNWDKNPKLQIIENTVDVNKVGTYTVVYQATDASNNKTVESIKVVVQPKDDVKPVDKEAPKITVIDRRVPLGETIDLRQGVTAIDNIDGDLTSKIVIDKGNLNTNKIGTYNVKYTVSDKAGNKSSEISKVEVYSNKPTLYGSDINILKNSKFNPLEGMKAYDVEDGDLSKKIKVSTDQLKIDTVGTYKLKYTITDSDNQTTDYIRRVNVVDKLEGSNEVPKINFDNGVVREDNLNLAVNDKFNPEKYVKAVDKEDGDISKSIKVIEDTVDAKKVGTYTVTYEVVDKNDNRTTNVLKVHILPEAFRNVTGDAPYIEASDITINVGGKYDAKAGVLALDKVDGDLTDKVVVSRDDVDTSNPGKYKVTYTVVDSDKHVTDKTITVTVTGKGKNPSHNGSNSNSSNNNSNSPNSNVNSEQAKGMKGDNKDNGKPKPIPNALNKLKSVLPGTGTVNTEILVPLVIVATCGLYFVIKKIRK